MSKWRKFKFEVRIYWIANKENIKLGTAIVLLVASEINALATG